MSENKTQPTDQSAAAFIEQIADEKRRAECQTLLTLIQEATGYEPRMWGESMVGFGQYHYRYASGRQGDSFLAGFSPRKQALTVYIVAGFENYPELTAKLGKFTTGRSCLYLKKLSDVDLDVLRELVKRSAEHMAATNPG